MNRIARNLLQAASSAAIIGLLALPSIADTIEIRRETSKQTISNVKVKGVKGENLQFQSESGNDSERPLANVYRLEINGETAFNDAEKAYAAETWPDVPGDAIDDFVDRSVSTGGHNSFEPFCCRMARENLRVTRT